MLTTRKRYFDSVRREIAANLSRQRATEEFYRKRYSSDLRNIFPSKAAFTSSLRQAIRWIVPNLSSVTAPKKKG